MLFTFYFSLFTFSCSSVIQSSSRPPQAIAVSSYAEAEAGTVIILDGGNSYDPEGNPVGCLWQESVENPEFNLIPDEVQKKFASENCVINIIPNQDGEYVFQLKVSDMIPGHKESEADLVSLLITPPPPPPNPPPVAIAKANLTRVVIGETVILTGEESFDQAGGGLTYFWEDYQNPVTGLVMPGAVTQAITFTQPGGYLFELTVFNGLAWSRSNSVRINVDSRVNRVPTAAAGEDRNVSYFEEVRLTGDRSSDPDGDQISYRWTQTAGPPVQLSPSVDMKEISFTVPDEILTYSFSLVVNDGGLASAPDTVTVRVWEHSTDNVPDAVWVDRFYPYLDSNGSRVKPYRKIQDAINTAYAYPGAISDVYVGEGHYYEGVTMVDGIGLYGGFKPARDWERDLESSPSYLKGIGDITLIAPKSIQKTTYLEGLRIYGTPSLSGYTRGIQCYSSNLVIRKNFIHGGGGELGAWGISIGSSSPVIYENIIFGGKSKGENRALRIGYDDTSTPPNSCPAILFNYINGGGLEAGGSQSSYGIYLSSDAYPVILNNVINPGFGQATFNLGTGLGNVWKRYGIYEFNGSGRPACPDGECNPFLLNNDIIKNHDWAVLYYDDDEEISESNNPIKSLTTISQVNALGNVKPEDYSKDNKDFSLYFSGAEFGDFHLAFDPLNPDNPVYSSPLIDAGIDPKATLRTHCLRLCKFDQGDDFCNLHPGDYQTLCGERFPWISTILASDFFDLELEPRPNCLLSGAANCFDIGPDEVYLNY